MRKQYPPPITEIDMNTNFRLYYEKDPNFYMTVIKDEDPAPEQYEFKLQLFKD